MGRAGLKIYIPEWLRNSGAFAVKQAIQVAASAALSEFGPVGTIIGKTLASTVGTFAAKCVQNNWYCFDCLIPWHDDWIKEIYL